MIKKIISRPVFASVISIIIVILGVLGLISIPVTQYPDIAPPDVKITANYPGANAQTVMQSVIIPIEQQINGVEGMDYITSSASNDGSATIDIIFKQGVNPDIAAVNTQNRVARAAPLLPAEVTRSGVVTQKQNTSALMYLSFYSSNPEYNDVFVQNYLNINIIPALKRINGVGDVSSFGGKTYSMRIWLFPEKLAVYNLVPKDVIAAINDQSREAAAGKLGQNSGSANEYTITYTGRFNDKAQYDDIIIKSLGNGQYLRLKDIADVRLSGISYTSIGRNRGMPAFSAGVFQIPGSNAREINDAVLNFLDQDKKNWPKGINYVVNFNTNEFLNASIEKVVHTLLEAFALVFLVVFIFLQDFRSTLIPAIAVPVSIIGAYFFLNLFGFSLNLLTLFALVLAIGIVVDDAIVVVEAVHAKMEHERTDARIATVKAMEEITGAIISITLVMASVFIPVTFISGPTGVFYKQFGITLIVAIAISAVNALTLSPVLCALFLKPNHNDKAYHSKNFVQKFYHKFNIAFRATTNRYGNLFVKLLRHKWITGGIIVASIVIIYFVNANTPKGFVPSEDRGIIFTNVELPPGTSLERTFAVMQELQTKAKKQIPAIEFVTFNAGSSFFSGAGGNCGLAFVRLKPFEQRDPHKENVDAIIKQLFGVASSIPEAKIVFFNAASVPGFGNNAGFEVQLLDKTGGDINKFVNVMNDFIKKLNERPEIQYVQTPLNINYPQYELNINVPRAAEVGVSVSDILSTLQGYIGGVYAADFSKYGQQYRVMVQAFPDARTDANSLNQLYVRTSSGAMSPIAQFVTLKRIYGPQSINRFNLYSSVKLTGANAEGFSTGDALKAVQEVVTASLPSGYGVDYSGLTRQEVNSSSQTWVIFVLSLVFVYFILSAQYESFLLPLSVIISLPCGIMGAYIGQNLMGLENNIYFQIALIMLVGLLAKNAILIVEFAIQRRHHGESLSMAAINAAKARLRPILMTSFAFIFGLLPLVFATGIGAVGNRSIATGAAIGLLIGTIIGLMVIPVLFVIFQHLQEKIKPLKKSSTQKLAE